MPKLHNPTEHDLTAALIHRNIRPGESETITDEQADFYRELNIFHVLDDDGNRLGPADAAATRKTVQRGAKQVEVTGAPAMEKR